MKLDEFNRQLNEECGISSNRLDIIYNESDSRLWTAVINGGSNILVTLHINKLDYGQKTFDVLSEKKRYIQIELSDVFSIINECLTQN